MGPALPGWIGACLIPTAALAGWSLQRARFAGFRVRMRPHYVAGYAAHVLAGAHALLSAGTMAGANVTGIRLATAALFALCAQAFVGASLQAPGAYRAPLRTWHRRIFWLAVLLTLGHVVLNAPLMSMFATP